MNTQTQAIAKPTTKLATLTAVAFAGLMMITVAGHVQAAALHDAAHDVRHATGFPCH